MTKSDVKDSWAIRIGSSFRAPSVRAELDRSVRADFMDGGGTTVTAQEARHHGVYSGFKAAKKTIAAETVASPVVVQTMTTGNDQN